MNFFYYTLGYLQAKGIADKIDDIEVGLLQRIKHAMPDNPKNHPEMFSSFLGECRDYINKWIMYDNLFCKPNN